MHSGILQLGYHHVEIDDCGKPQRTADGASDVPLETYYQRLANDIVILTQLRGVLKFGDMLFSVWHDFGHVGLTRILRDYSRAGDTYPAALVLRDLIRLPLQYVESAEADALRRWIPRSTAPEDLERIANLWLDREREFVIPQTCAFTEADFFERVLSSGKANAYTVAVYLYLGDFKRAREKAILAHQVYMKNQPLIDPAWVSNSTQMNRFDEHFLAMVLESCEAERIVFRHPPAARFPDLN